MATVDGQGISLASYHDWLKAAAVSAHSGDKYLPAFVPDAPKYPRCIAYERTALGKTGKSQSVATLRSFCSDLRVTLAEDVMEFLLSARWFLDEGSREGVSVSAAQVQKAMHSSIPKTAGLKEFLSTNGLTSDDLQYEARTALIAEKLSERHTGPTPTITSTEISDYYTKYHSEMDGESLAKATPAIREILVETAQAPTYDAWTSKIQKHFQPLTVCAPGYRIGYYCKGAAK